MCRSEDLFKTAFAANINSKFLVNRGDEQQSALELTQFLEGPVVAAFAVELRSDFLSTLQVLT
jgi:hypothetical protein